MRRIYVDENIPHAQDFFKGFGEVTTFHGRELQSKDLAEANILIVRSITKVNQELLAGSAVEFVGTATAGTNHLNKSDLDALNIPWSSAAGCNAVAVAEYVLAILLKLYSQKKLSPSDTIGVIGYGKVGQALIRKLNALNIPWIAYDPPRAQTQQDIEYANWDDLGQCKLITCHTPYTQNGPYPTHKMLNQDSLIHMRPGFHLINACRGEVIDEDSLTSIREKIGDIFLDVFWEEPKPNLSWMKAAQLNTPHIAGYSFRGKLNGSAILVEKLNDFLGTQIPINQNHFLSKTSTLEFEGDLIKSLITWMPGHYNPWDDFESFTSTWNANNRDVLFDQLRKNYPIRYEFGDIDLKISNTQNHNMTLKQQSEVQSQLLSLGFKTVEIIN